MLIIITNMIVGLSMGRVMWKNFCTTLAPSMSAASYTAEDTPCTPASRITELKPRFFQMLIIITEGIAHALLVSHGTLGRPMAFKAELIKPKSSLYSHCHTMAIEV